MARCETFRFWHSLPGSSFLSTWKVPVPSKLAMGEEHLRYLVSWCFQTIKPFPLPNHQYQSHLSLLNRLQGRWPSHPLIANLNSNSAPLMQAGWNALGKRIQRLSKSSEQRIIGLHASLLMFEWLLKHRQNIFL